MDKKQEKFGVLLVIASALLWALFPIIVNKGTQNIPPLTFAALSTLTAAIGGFFYTLKQGKLNEIKNRKAYFPLLMITLSIVVIPYILFFTGAKLTSGVNTAMLLLSEIVFTIIFTHFIGEKTTLIKLLGAGGILLGAILIMYNGTFRLNTGDILILFSTLTYPLGNFYSKKVLNYITPATILLVRSILGGLFILGLAIVFEKSTNLQQVIASYWPLILLNGLVILGLSKILWFESLKRLDISKAISLVMTFPLFSITFLIFFFNETVSIYQGVGILIIIIGLYYSIKRPSVDPNLTKYGL